MAIELLSSGHAREEAINYLRSTFGLGHAEAMVASAGLWRAERARSHTIPRRRPTALGRM